MDQPTQEFLDLPILAWIPALPLIGALLNLTFGRWFSKQTVHTIAVAAVAAAFGIAAYSVFGPLYGEFRAGAGGIGLYHSVYTWIQVGWIVVQVLVLQRFHVMQPTIFVLGVLITALAWHLPRRPLIARRPR